MDTTETQAISLDQEVILTNQDYFYSLLKDINQAKESIDLEVYIFNDDVIGKEITNALIAAANRGVKIRVLVDGVGSPSWGGEITQKMHQAGIRTRVYHPFPWKIWHWGQAAHVPKPIMSKALYLLSHMNFRNHRKTCLIDNKIAYVGSANIAECHLPQAQGGSDWRDTTVRVSNQDVIDLKYAFGRAWRSIRIKERLKTAFRIANANPIFRLNYSLRRRRILYKHLLLRIHRCHDRIWVTNAYFVPDDHLLTRIIAAAKRGVDVRILLPSKSDVFMMSFVSTTFYTLLLKAGVAIYEYLPSVLHAKILIIDNWYTVGSTNLNFRSFRHDQEVDVNIRTSSAQAALEKQFLMDLSHSRRVTLDEMKKQPFYQKILGRMLLTLRYWI